MRAKDERLAARLRSRGWQVAAPVEPADPGADVWPTNPCIDGCPDPARHAEGGHDV